jgi:2-alkenal reductase
MLSPHSPRRISETRASIVPAGSRDKQAHWANLDWKAKQEPLFDSHECRLDVEPAPGPPTMTNNTFQRLAILGLILVAGLWFGSQFIQNLLLTAREERAVTPRGDLASFERTTTQLFRNAAPSVVYIYTERRGTTLFGGQSRQQGTGSGFVWDRGGHIITNHHVIAGADQVYVRFDSGSAAQARIVGGSPDHDLAVLRVSQPATSLTPIPIGDSDTLEIGQAVFAIGNPFGLSRTLTTGIVSALDRSLPAETGREISGMIQTDAAINPGNSGGPLLDSAGRLIGVNTAIISGTGSYSGIGFAVPVATVNKIVPQLIEKGRAARPGIGIRAASEGLAGRLGIEGVIIYDIAPSSPAARAGLRGLDLNRQTLGDVILAVNGRPTASLARLAAELDKIGIGKTARLTILRNGQKQEFEVDIVDIG